jgi:hypothetical protein
MTGDVLSWGIELAGLAERGRPDGMSAHRAATAAAEEVGECIGAHNKYADGRVPTLDHFRVEWAQAMLMLTVLGAKYLDEDEMVAALSAEMKVQRARWTA